MASAAATAPSAKLGSSFVGRSDALERRPSRVTVACPGIVTPRAEAANPEISRRNISLASAGALLATVFSPLPALADFEQRYTDETKNVIDKVRYTLTLPKDDPARPDAVTELRGLSNDWVAKYRREKAVAGRPSFSNMYSVLNAISGHYISFGPTYPIPKKRADRIFEEIDIAERALSRGR